MFFFYKSTSNRNIVHFVQIFILQNGLSPLAVAAREGYAEIASMYIERGAYVNAVDRVQCFFFVCLQL